MIEAAEPGDTIEFDGSLSGETITLETGAIDIDKSLEIIGLGLSELTIDANHESQIFTISGDDVSISGLTLANGEASTDGGAIEDLGGDSLTVTDSAFSGNAAGGDGGGGASSGSGYGGAIYADVLSLTVSGSTFSGNSAGGNGGEGNYTGQGKGGAIYANAPSSLAISESTFSGNSVGGEGNDGTSSGSGSGGAIYASPPTATVEISDSAFSHNTAGGRGDDGFNSGHGGGGAVSNASDGSMTISDSTFSDNSAGGEGGSEDNSGVGNGGAVTIAGSASLTISNSTLSDNSSGGDGGEGESSGYGYGGAIGASFKPLTISGSTLSGNTAGGESGSGSGSGRGNGGAIYASGVDLLSATNSTFVENEAGGIGSEGSGGAITLAGKFSTAMLVSVTIDANSVGAGGNGAGINEIKPVLDDSAITARGTIVSGNTGATNCNMPVVSSSYSLEGPSAGDTSCGFDLPSADPELEPLADNGGPTETQALPESSPAVDAVPAASCPTSVDQRGEPRPDNGKPVCDVGAYELQNPVAPGIASGPEATFQVGKGGSFTVEGTGFPSPNLSVEGALPGGIGFTDNGDGTASLSGTPAADADGDYPLTIEASNGVAPAASQSFTLTVRPPQADASAPPMLPPALPVGSSAPPPLPPRVSILGRRLVVFPRRVWVRLSCRAPTADGACRGKVWVTAPRRPRRARRSRTATPRAIALARGRYALRSGRAGPIGLRLTRRGKRVLKRAGRRRLRAGALVVVDGGHRVYRSLVLALRYRPR